MKATGGSQPGAALPASLLAAALWMLLAGSLDAQVFSVLHSFSPTTGPSPNSTNSDGSGPIAGLLPSGNTLYGTAQNGGKSGFGTLFELRKDGSSFTNLYSFSGGSDGGDPAACLVMDGGVLYGTAEDGGMPFGGTVFRFDSNGAGFATLHAFAFNTDGGYPVAGLVVSGTTLYGTATSGGRAGNGTVYKLNADGTGFTTLHDFTSLGGSVYRTNTDGARPVGGLILSGDTLYGTTQTGGYSGNGTVFTLQTDGSRFAALHHFTPFSGSLSRTNNDGARPAAGLILSTNTLYGTTYSGGGSGNGTLFAIKTDGSDFTNLHSFTPASGPGLTNSDGMWPNAGLILSGGTLYGTASGGGTSGMGTVFAINTDGTGFTNLHNFSFDPGDGALPYGGVALSANTLYGTTFNGGTTFHGTVYSLSFPPRLTGIRDGSFLLLKWPARIAGFDYTGFTLQCITNLSFPVWEPVSPNPTLLDGHMTARVPIAGTQQLYRLVQ